MQIKLFSYGQHNTEEYAVAFITDDGEIEFVVDFELLYDFLCEYEDRGLKDRIQVRFPMQDANPQSKTGIKALDLGLTWIPQKNT